MSAEAPAATAAHAASAAPVCENCGASVSGRYCGACGQRLEPPVHTLGHFARIATEDLTHADSRLWSTLLALLAKPGKLTREFLAGRRARYLPPVRLYLVVSVVFFLWMAFHSGDSKTAIISFDDAKPPPAAAAPAAAPPATVPSGKTATAPPPPASAGSGHVSVRAKAKPEDCEEVTYDGPWAERIRPFLHDSCLKMVKDNGRSVSAALVHNLPHAMFVFLPLLAAAMMLFYWRPRRYYVEHLLFLVHNHAFVFVFIMLAWLLTVLLPPIAPAIRIAATLYVIWYVYRAMRTVYGQGRGRTIAKLLAMSFLYAISAALMFTITIVYSVLTT
jgi:Protein of unknown function (DUF3667)